MKTYFLLMLMLAFSSADVYSQQTERNRDTAALREFTVVQVEAKFPGGASGWQAYLENNLKVRTPVKHHAPAGTYRVEVSFIVLTDGTITDIEVLKDPGFGCANEAVRVLKKSPNWIPATQNGKKVVYRQKQSITFLVD